MTEYFFDVNNPDKAPQASASSEPIQGISEFLNFSHASGRPATIVLPTRQMYSGTLDANHDAPRAINETYLKDVVSFVTKLLTPGDGGANSLPDVPIASFEIGNEYWQSGEMTSAEYGQLVNTLVAEIGKVFDQVLGPDAAHPDIVIQMGGPWDAQFDAGIYSGLSWQQRVTQSNQDIISQITDPNAISNITGLVEHYYYSNSSSSLPQNSAALEYIDWDLNEWESAGFSGLDLFLTEWNIRRSNDTQLGLKGASVLIEQMEHMIALGADGAFVWPLQGGTSGLAGPVGSTPQLSPIGAAFKLMSESLIGMNLIQGGTSSASLEVDAYTSDSKVVLFIMSRSDVAQSVNLDVSSIVGRFLSMDGVKIGISDDTSVTDPFAHAVLTNYDSLGLGDGTLLDFELGSFEVMKVEFHLAGNSTPSGVSFRGTGGADKFAGGAGSDSISGANGSDSLIGGAGDDILNGGLGGDLLNAWGGDDEVFGGIGADRIYSQEGDDLIYGGRGCDVIRSVTGDDTLLGGDGRDTLYGGEGADEVSGGDGGDLLFGGAGADRFVFRLTSYGVDSSDTIGDFEAGIDKIYLDRFAGLAAVGTPFGSSAFTTNDTGLATDLNTRMIFESDTGFLWYDCDGIGSEFSGVVFAKLTLGVNLSYFDLVQI